MRIERAMGLGLIVAGMLLSGSSNAAQPGAIDVVREQDLTPGPSTPGITRQFAFRAPGTMVMLAQSKPGFASGWHDHTNHDVFGYVVSGTVIFESGGNTFTVRPGEFFHVPPNTVHRETNPSPNEKAQVVLFVTGSGPMVENVEAPTGSNDPGA